MVPLELGGGGMLPMYIVNCCLFHQKTPSRLEGERAEETSGGGAINQPMQLSTYLAFQMVWRLHSSTRLREAVRWDDIFF